MTNEELARIRMLEATLEKEAQALADSLLQEKASIHFGHPPVKSILFQEDMQWLLYDEPLMLYIDVDDFRTEHAEFE